MKLEVLNREDALRQIADELHSPPATMAVRIAFLCEQIRAVIAVHFESGHGGSISTLRIVRTVAAKAKPLFDELEEFDSLESEIRKELEQLVSLNELISEDGNFCFSPTRLIVVSDDWALLIGAGPFHYFPQALRSITHVVGRTRLVSWNMGTRQLLDNLPIQSIEDWLCLSESGPLAWVHGIHRTAVGKMIQVHNCVAVEQFEDGRILSDEKLMASSRLALIRYRADEGIPNKQYALASVSKSNNGKAVVSKIFNLNINDARRLRYSLTVNGKSAELPFVQDETSFQIVLYYPFPAPEVNFLSLALENQTGVNSKGSKRYRFSLRLLPILRKVAASLGVSLVEVESLGKK